MTNPFQPAQIDFSMLANLPQLYQRGQQWGRERNLRNELGSIVGPNGEFDANKAMGILMKYDPENALKLQMAQSGVYGTPIYTQDESGNIGISAIPKMGGPLQPLNTGGRRVLEPQHFVNQGTQVTPFGTRSGLPGGASIPIDVAGQQAAQTQGTIQGQSAAAIPDVLLNAQNAIQSIDQAIAAPGRETATGMSSQFDPRNYVAGTEATSYREGILKQVQGQAFLGSIQQMRGMGSLSDAEGRAATAAQSALSTAQTDADHLRALKELKAIQLRGVLRTYQKAGQDAPQEVIDAWTQAEQESNIGKKVPFKAEVAPSVGPMTGRSLVPNQASAVQGIGEGVYPEAGPRPSENDMQMLQQHANDPQFRAEFEALYGPGSVDRWLGAGEWKTR